MSGNGSTLVRPHDAMESAGPAAVQLASVRVRPVLPDAVPNERSLVVIGPVDCIALGQGRPFIVNGRTIAVFRQRDGRVFAADNQCPHRGGPLAEGIVGDGKVICPLHGWKIDLASGRCLGEAAQVRTYAVHIIDGQVLIECGSTNAAGEVDE